MISAAVIIASFSWKFVEKPFRGQRSLVQSRKLLFAGAAVGSAIFVLFAGVLFLTHGLAGRFGNQVLRLLASENDYWEKRNACIDRICRIGDNQTTPSFILWGDSHAGAIAPVFEQIATASHVSGFVAFSPACAPLAGLKRYDEDDVEKCARFNRSVLDFIGSSHIKNVFLYARWGLYAEGNRYGREWGAPILLTADRKPQEDYARFASLLTSTIEELQRSKANVVIVASVPEIGMDVPTSLARGAATGRLPEALAIPYPEFMARQARTFGLVSQVTQKYKLHLVYPHRLLCDNAWCPTAREGRVLYVDSNHLSIQGAMYLAPAFALLLKSGIQGPV